MTLTAASSALDQVSYEDLYARWEKGNWSATALDFTVDREHWLERFDEHRRAAAIFNYALFFWGEDAVADNLSPYIDAAPREEQKYFLATQQVDEARHAVFFKRFMHEVVGIGDGTAAGGLQAIKPELTWGFRETFDHLDEMADRLRKDRSRHQFAKAITLYHMVIEATLAQPGQHFITSYLEREDLMPGFREGMVNVALDEQRHIAFGMRVLADLIAEDPSVKEAVIAELQEVMPKTLGVFVPPNWDESYVTTFGMTIEELYADALVSFESKLRLLGFTQEEMQRALPQPLELAPLERARRGLDLLRANYLGERPGPPSRDPEDMALLFDVVRLSVDHRFAPRAPRTIQWAFEDAEPWYLRLDNGSTHVAAGSASRPDLTLHVRFDDFVDLISGRQDARRLMLRRRLRPKGSVRLLLSMQRFMPTRS